MKINNKIIALTSNKKLFNGEDKIIFYNYYAKKRVEDVKNYSFTLSQNNLTLMPREGTIKTLNINESKKLLLGACKKYKEEQKNGILLLKLDSGDDTFKILSYTFYETKNFEVYCFCPISKFDEKNFLTKENNNLLETNKFLVGGFDSDKNKGLIKLYKVNYNKDNFEKTSIEDVKNIEIEIELSNNGLKNFDGFNGYITCITQSRYDGKILMTCSDGSVYLFHYNDNLFQ